MLAAPAEGRGRKQAGRRYAAATGMIASPASATEQPTGGNVKLTLGTKRVPLHARDGSVRAYALVDAEDLAAVEHFSWHLHSQGYAVRTYDRGRKVGMHRQILELSIGRSLEAGELAHHDNEDKLDNRRANLKLDTRRTHPHTHYHGIGRFVSFHRRRRQWHAYTPAPKRSLGWFATEAAALAAVEQHMEAVQ